MIFAYVRASTAHIRPWETADGQAALIQEFCARRGLTVSEWFADGTAAAGVPWLERPAGRRLAARLTPGCRVVVAAGDYVRTTPQDLLAVLQNWRARAVSLSVAWPLIEVGGASFRLSSAGAAGAVLIETLRLVVAFQGSRASERVRMGLGMQKAKGLRYCRHPGYGFAWKWQKGQQVRVPDPAEQATVARIIERRNDGASWYRIARELLHDRVWTRDGREWSPDRVRRAYFAVRSHAEA
jgi:DNA invertase Pin-like site-specific DNA recombinase